MWLSHYHQFLLHQFKDEYSGKCQVVKKKVSDVSMYSAVNFLSVSLTTDNVNLLYCFG